MIDTLEHLTVSEFLRNRYPFVIPKYQRGYAWEKEEVADFCKDVQALIGSDADTHHFFGSVLTSRLPVPRSERGDYLEIIDGQQRISTFFLTLSLILHALKKIVDSATAAGETAIKEAAEANYQLWTNSYVQYDEINNNRMVKCLRLTLSKVDAKFFEDLVYDRSAAIGGAVQPSSHQRLAIAKRLLWKNLFRDCIEGNSCTLAQRLDHVCKVKGAVLDKCRLIHVRSTSRKDGYSLFMVLNDRGRDISDAEKLRASTLELLENHQVQQNHVEACWDSILQKTPNIIEGFLKSFYASKVGTRAGRDLFRGYSDHFIPFEKASDVSTADGL